MQAILPNRTWPAVPIDDGDGRGYRGGSGGESTEQSPPTPPHYEQTISLVQAGRDELVSLREALDTRLRVSWSTR